MRRVRTGCLTVLVALTVGFVATRADAQTVADLRGNWADGVNAGDTTAMTNPVDYYSGRWDYYSADTLEALARRWSFNDFNDSVGNADVVSIYGNAQLAGGQLVLDGAGDFVQTAVIGNTITEKTLIAWVTLNNLEQGNGCAALGIQEGGGVTFDSIVYEERTPRQWMAGSDFFRRTPVNNGGPAETSTEEVMMAIVYGSDNSISIYRNGALYAPTYVMHGLQTYDAGVANFVLGRRALSWGPELNGSINEARIYADALTADQIALLYGLGPDQLEEPSGVIPEPAGLGLIGMALLSLRRKRRAL